MMKNNFEYREYKVIKKTQFTADSFLFEFEGKMDFTPGQFVQISLDHFGEGTYAICSDPENKKSFELCIRGCGNLSNRLTQMLPGDLLKLRGPYGNGWPMGKMLEKEILFIAGGMGLVPLRPVIYQVLRYRSAYKKLFLVSGFRSDELILFKDEVEKWKDDKRFNQFIGIAEHSGPSWWGEQGMITEGLKKAKYNPKNTVALICGPDVMVPYCNDILLQNSTKEENIYISYERRMECGIGVCQHCSVGKYLVCKDGPVFSLAKIKSETGK